VTSDAKHKLVEGTLVQCACMNWLRGHCRRVAMGVEHRRDVRGLAQYVPREHVLEAAPAAVVVGIQVDPAPQRDAAPDAHAFRQDSVQRRHKIRVGHIARLQQCGQLEADGISNKGAARLEVEFIFLLVCPVVRCAGPLGDASDELRGGGIRGGCRRRGRC
jgi:hypothetical protein